MIKLNKIKLKLPANTILSIENLFSKGSSFITKNTGQIVSFDFLYGLIPSVFKVKVNAFLFSN